MKRSSKHTCDEYEAANDFSDGVADSPRYIGDKRPCVGNAECAWFVDTRIKARIKDLGTPTPVSHLSRVVLFSQEGKRGIKWSCEQYLFMLEIRSKISWRKAHDTHQLKSAHADKGIEGANPQFTGSSTKEVHNRDCNWLISNNPYIYKNLREPSRISSEPGPHRCSVTSKHQVGYPSYWKQQPPSQTSARLPVKFLGLFMFVTHHHCQS